MYLNSAERLEEISVKERYNSQLKRMKVKDKKEAETRKPNFPANVGDAGQKYHEIRYFWEVEIASQRGNSSK